MTFVYNEGGLLVVKWAGGSPWHRRNTADFHARGKWKLLVTDYFAIG